MKAALIFLNGYYDTRYLDFYRQEIETALENRSPLICADGGIWIFDALNQCGESRLIPDVLIGDMDSVADRGYKPLLQEKQSLGDMDSVADRGYKPLLQEKQPLTQAKHVVQEWIGKTDKDYTDGQLAVDYALEQYGCRHIIIYGGLPRPEGYETDQFLGNLKLMRFGHYRVSTDEHYSAEMRDPKQTIHYVLSSIRLVRKNSGLQRVSLIAEADNVVVETSENLRWDLASLHIHPDLTNALRNEFVAGAEWAALQLTEGSAPVYVIHNW
ncbi:MAG: hypothetical protein OXU51_02325 [Candidatus Poribacteria bacterium]|nr:hypothetical protein [Candidatus Poribacteria bacterium]